MSPVGISGVVAVAAGRHHTCVLALGGALGSTVRCWGDNEHGQLGDGTRTDRAAPVMVQDLTNAISIAAGDNHTCALIVDGTVRCWGEGTNGELGNGSNTSQFLPVRTQGLSGAVAITAGGSHTCVVVVGGCVGCWGSNILGQLGDGTSTNRPSPVSVLGLSGAVAPYAGVAVIFTSWGSAAQPISRGQSPYLLSPPTCLLQERSGQTGELQP